MRNHLIEELSKIAALDKNVVLINGDLGFGVLEVFERTCPDRYFNAGICEQNMMGVAAGIALTGKKVYVYSLSNFPWMRCLEQVRNDVCYPNADVKIIAVGGGFSYGELGMSHHSTEDIAMLRCLPNMHIFTPADVSDAIRVLHESYNISGPCYIRLGRGHEQDLPGDRSQELSSVQVIKEGKDLAIISYGPVIWESIKAAKTLAEDGIDAEIVNITQIKPLPSELNTILSRFDNIITVEEHTTIGGIGSIIAELVSSTHSICNIIKLGLNDCFTSIVGTPEYLRDYYSLSSSKIVQVAKEAIVH